jgi:murein L,D-transpeptidase YcbB/YkuD
MRLVLFALGLVASLSVVAQSVVAQSARDSGAQLRGAANGLLAAALETRTLGLQTAADDPNVAPPVSPVAPAVSSFYQQRGFQPVWTETPRLQELITALEGLSADGLDPEDYSINFLRQMYELLAAGRTPELSELVEWELLATNAYLRALYHLFNGKVDPAGLDPQWNFELHELAPEWVAGLMNDGISSRNIAQSFAQTRPQHPTYASLQAGLSRYREFAAQGGWFALPAGPTLKPCMVDPQVAQLRARLRVTGEYQPVAEADQQQALANCLAANAASSAKAAAAAQNSSAGASDHSLSSADDSVSAASNNSSAATSEAGYALDPAVSAELGEQLGDATSAASSAPPINPDEVFDEYLVNAVKQFQRDQYLEDDGAVGPATRAALNISAHARVEQIRVNLDRARWLLHHIPEELLLVDIAGFKVTYFRGGKALWKSRVQVGMSYRTTPVFKSEVNYITLNPTWTVPPTILRKDILPKLRKDLSYLREHNIRVLDSNGQQLDPATIDWSRPGNVTLRQDAGDDAALGKAVIRFPNPYAVYLHDTPHQKLFNKSQRAFSSGCIRVERALELVELLLEQTPGWDEAAINKTLATGKTRNVTLAKRVPIMLAYWTVDAVSDTKVAFKPDIYARDGAVLAALNRRVSQPLIQIKAED